MSDPRRLLDDGDDLERTLLSSALSDRPSPAKKMAALAAIGLTVPPAAIDPIGSGSTAAGGSGAAAGAAGAKVVGAKAAGLVTKWIVGVLFGAAAVSASVVATRPESDDPIETPAKTQRSSPISPIPAPAPTLVPVPVPMEVAPAAAPSAVWPARKVTPKPKKQPESLVAEQSAESARDADETVSSAEPEAKATVVPSPLEREIAWLDQVRAKIDSGEPEKAIEALGEYAREHPEGTLAPEADALRIDAYLLARRHEEAEALAREFLRAHPRSPLAPRYRALADRAGSK